METLQNCPCCYASQFSHHLSCVDNTVSHQKFEVMACKNCGFLFTNPRPSASEIGYYYQSEAYISHSNTQKGVLNTAYQLVRKITLRSKIKLIKKYQQQGFLLDIGCGTGEFLHIAQKNGYQTQGIEPDENARAMAIKNYALQVAEPSYLAQIPEASVAIITMWHVMEHVHELEPRIKTIHKLLQDGGIAIIAVPNPKSLDAQHYQQHWAGYDLPRHLYHFEPQLLRQMFEKQGLKSIETKIMPFDGFYVSLLSQKYKNGTTNYPKAIWIGLLSLLHAMQNKDTGSSQIYIFRK